ncbi:MAG: NAD(P)H-hydrate epimerase [Candidatus Dojkabacteria bacterium]|nr:NAD(P)H-hydrate epimerase [Candidatus Dojkabacteria bacterium]MDQ7021133.1 NAD(P)H-hydrate epimerase [Candidatus Dojkabacteria bacterium]
MIDDKIRSKILNENFTFYGIDLEKYYIKAGVKFSEKIIESSKKINTISIICGLGGNGADGIATAIALAKGNKDLEINTYLIGRSNLVEEPVINLLLAKLVKLKNINFIQDAYAKDIENSDVIIESLVGTGLKGEKLNKRFRDVIKKISHYKKPIIALDVNTPHYKPKNVISINYPKTEDAEVIGINYPGEYEMIVGPGDVNALKKPNSSSHKSKNGNMLVIKEDSGGFEIVKNFSKNYLVKNKLFAFNQRYLTKSKENVDIRDLEISLEMNDSIMLLDTEYSIISKASLEYILSEFCNKTYVINGDIIDYLDIEKIRNVENKVLILDRKDLVNMFKDSKASNGEGKLKRFSIENNFHIVLIGSQSILYSPEGEVKTHRSSNIYSPNYKLKLSSLIASFATRNNLWLSIRAGVFEVDKYF